MEVTWLIGAGVAAIVWAVRQEGRVNLHDRLHKQHIKRQDEMNALHSKRHDEMREDVSYIRQRIDSALNGKH